MNIDTTTVRQHAATSRRHPRKLGPTLAFLETQLADRQQAFREAAAKHDDASMGRELKEVTFFGPLTEEHERERIARRARLGAAGETVNTNEMSNLWRACMDDQIRMFAAMRRKAAAAVHAVVVHVDRMRRLQPRAQRCVTPPRLIRVRSRARRARVVRAVASKTTSTGDPDSSSDGPGDRARLRAVPSLVAAAAHTDQTVDPRGAR